METRIELHESLKQILGSESVYFQPPESVKMVYPCIVYGLENVKITHANDKPYLGMKCYNITIIDKDPDSEIPDRFLAMPFSSFVRVYTAHNLNHWVFTLYF